MRILLTAALGLTLWLLSPSGVDAQLRPGQIQQTMRQRISAVQRCYQSSSVAGGQAPGRIDVRIQVGPRGRVAKVDIMRTTVAPALLSCVRRVLSRARFPRSKRGTTFTYPMIFTPQT